MILKTLSPSRINCYLSCSMQFYFRYVEGIKTAKNLSLAFGSAVHGAIQTNYEQKIETLQDLPTEQVLDAFSDQYETEIQEVDRAEILEADQKEGSVKDNGIRLLETYQKEVSPKIQPLAVEQHLEVSFKDFPTKLNGIIDLEDSFGWIIDHKTTTRRKEVPESYKLQHGAYKILKQAEGNPVNGSRIDWMIRKKKPEILSVEVTPDEKYTLMIFQLVCAGIEKEVFTPNRDSMLCNRKYCAYWNECEKKIGGKVKGSED